MSISQMNGLPLIYRVLCDYGQPGRMTFTGAHTSVGTALRSIFRDTIPSRSWHDTSRYWVEDMRGRVVAGPFNSAHRPSVAERAQP